MFNQLTPASTLVMSSTRMPLRGPFLSVSVFRGGVPAPDEDAAVALSHLRGATLILGVHCI